jgi:hypothetical protein
VARTTQADHAHHRASGEVTLALAVHTLAAVGPAASEGLPDALIVVADHELLERVNGTTMGMAHRGDRHLLGAGGRALG